VARDHPDEVELWMRVQEAWDRYYAGRGKEFTDRYPEYWGVQRVAFALRISRRTVEEMLTR
jgi:hypothetical protein